MNVDVGTIDTVVIFGLLLLSVASWFMPLAVFGIRRLVFAIKKKFYVGPASVTKMIWLSLCLFGAIWLLRYSVAYYGVITASDELSLTRLEALIDSLFHAVETFSMGEDYTTCILGGKQMLWALIGEGTVWAELYGIYVTVLNIVAPIIGGVAVFEIISGIFPKVRLFMSRFAWYREKYYFSQLNDASLALAKSIFEINSKAFARPLFIFTDAYSVNDGESASERMNSAKTMGAICVKDDITHVFIGKRAKKKIFLIDDGGNTEKLTRFTHSSKAERLKGAEIFVFTEDGTYIQVEKRVYEKLKSVFADENDIPNIVPIHSYKNLVSDLLVKIPLYEPLIHRKRNADGSVDLTVSIFGLGDIGTQMFLAVYWFGQMLGCNLNINVISAESEDAFWDKINYINPEIRATTEDGNPILAYDRKGGISPRYCKVNYISGNVESSGFISDISFSDGGCLLDTDYFFISLGSDSQNISFANTLCKYAAEKQICEYDPQNPLANQKNTVITYVVYNSSVAQALNQNSMRRFTHGAAGIYMRAVGTLDEVYSQRNAFMPEYEEPAKAAGTSYLEMRKERTEKMKKRRRNTYSYMSSRARAMHVKYKAFSLGFVETSLFDTNGIESLEYKNAQTEAYCRYRDFSKGENVSNREEWRHQMHLIAWLEKRRWNAYIRTLGIRSTTAYDAYATERIGGSYQQLDVGLHPCLLECSKDGIRGVLLDNGEIDEATLFQAEDKSDFDLLDDLSYDLYNKHFNSYDFKQYDYPCGGDVYAVERFLAAGTVQDTKKRREVKEKGKNSPDRSVAQVKSTKPRETYTPCPIDTSAVTLSEDMQQLTERLAENVHENWSRGRIADGWSYGEKRDDTKKTTPCLVPYGELTDGEKQYDRVTALETLKTITALGYTITKAEESSDESDEKQKEAKELMLQG